MSTYADLGPGEGFLLVNDHDPKPLYYQFAAEYTDRFTWDDVESGPEVWKVRIGRPEAAWAADAAEPRTPRIANRSINDRSTRAARATSLHRRRPRADADVLQPRSA